MATNAFGTLFRCTTWGESHGKAIGVVIDGCPAGLPISDDEINQALAMRAPGKTSFTSPRKEPDRAEILSGVFEGKTTGTPISIIIPNQDVDSSKYEPIKDLLRPGHANFTYLEKYGCFDYRGGGRASARETAARVAAGAVAKKLLAYFSIEVVAYLKAIAGIEAEVQLESATSLYKMTYESPIFCPDVVASQKIAALIADAIKAGDSVGGVVEFLIRPMIPGLGDPIYEKLEACLAKAMLSIPAAKGFEIGSGFSSAHMKGSIHNDAFMQKDDKIETRTNHAGGILGGIATGMPLYGKVAFKPTSSIMQAQESVTTKGETATFAIPSGSRHDPCVAIRAVPVVEAMAAIVIADALLMNRSAKL